jgi:hypothetical protein
MILERCVDYIAKRTIVLYVDLNDDLILTIDNEKTMFLQGRRFVNYEDARLLAIETAKSVHVLHDWFFTWSGAMAFIKNNTQSDKSTSTVLDASITKLPFFGYIVLRTML